MKGQIININFNIEEFAYLDIVDIISIHSKILGHTIKNLLDIQPNEIAIQKISSINGEIIITKCNKDDVKILPESKEDLKK